MFTVAPVCFVVSTLSRLKAGTESERSQRAQLGRIQQNSQLSKSFAQIQNEENALRTVDNLSPHSAPVVSSMSTTSKPIPEIQKKVKIVPPEKLGDGETSKTMAKHVATEPRVRNVGFDSLSEYILGTKVEEWMGQVAWRKQLSNRTLRETKKYTFKFDERTEDIPVEPEEMFTPLESFVISPKYRLLACRIDKNANIGLALFVNRLNGFTWDLGASQPEQFDLEAQNINEILHDKTWRKIVLLRDPLERFLSGYLSKCIQHEDSPCVEDEKYVHTPGCEKDPNFAIPNGNCMNFETFEAVKEPVSFDGFINKAMETFMEFDAGEIDGFNVHFTPQLEFCGGLESTIGHYTHVEFVNRSLSQKMHELIDEMRKDPSLPEFPKRFQVEDLYPTDGSVHKTHQKPSGAHENMERYYGDQKVCDKAMSMYARDYLFTGLSPPTFVELAESDIH